VVKETNLGSEVTRDAQHEMQFGIIEY